MTSARTLLVTVAFGLAACAHTHSDIALELPDIRRTAPVLIVDSEKAPPGFDEHIVIIIDQERLAQAYRNAGSGRFTGPLYYDPGYAYRRPVAHRPTVSGSPGNAMPSPASAPPSVSRPSPGVPERTRPESSRYRDARR